MNAPAPAAAVAVPKPTLELLELKAITPSKTHIQELRRQRFDKKALEDLADSIRQVGVLQPIVVRPDGLAGRYELVAGERRFLAAKLAGLAEIRASVCVLTPEQVLEIQLIENLQREGLHELEEAEGYEELMKLKKINADQVADMVGKSRSYVYARTKLLALCPEARKAFYAGELDASRALLIARIGHHDTQRQALKDVLQGVAGWGGRRDGAPMSYREAHRHILQNYMLKLAGAPFDINDATLLPKAGDCVKCPKRTGNQADLFGDVKNADVCTDPKCFDDKRQANFSKAAKDLEAKGKRIVYGDAAKKLFPDWDSTHDHSRDRLSERYVPIDEQVYIHGRGHVTPAQVLGDDFEPTLIQHPGTGKIFRVASRQAIDAAASKKRAAGAAKKASAKKGPKLPDVDDVLTERLAKLIHEKAPKEFGRTWIATLAKMVREHISTRDLEAVALAWGWKSNAFQSGGYGYSRKWPAEADKLGERDLVLLMFDIIFAIGQYTRAPVLKLFGINEQQVREQILEERKQARLAAKAKPAAAPKGKRPVDKVNAAIDKRAAKAKASKAKGKKK